MLLNVKLSIVVDGDTKRAARAKVKQFLHDPSETFFPYNFMIHEVEKDDTFCSLEELRRHQTKQHYQTQ